MTKKTAEIFNIAPTTPPDLLLEMAIANLPNKSSVVVSILREEDGKIYHHVYHSEANNSDLAYHAISVDHYIKEIINKS